MGVGAVSVILTLFVYCLSESDQGHVSVEPTVASVGSAGPRGVSDSEDEPYSSPDTTLQYPGRPKTAPGGGAKVQPVEPATAAKVRGFPAPSAQHTSFMCRP